MPENTFQLLLQAEELAEIERWPDAIKLLRQVIAQEPRHFHANCLLSQCFYELKELDQALNYAEKAVSIEPDEEWGHRLRSIILGELGRKKECVEAAQEAVRLAPLAAPALQTLVFAYLENNQTRRAIKIAERMRENFPHSDATFFALGNAYLQKGELGEAEANFRESLRLNPLNPNARNNLGVVMLRQKTPSSAPSILATDNDAITHFTEAARLEPTNEFALENLRSQFSYRLPIYGTVSLLPFLSLWFLVAPIGAVITILLTLWSLSKLFLEIREKRRQLSPEMRTFLDSTPNRSMTGYLVEFKAVAGRIFQRTALPHLLAVLAVLVNFAGLFNPSYRSVYQLIAVLMMIAGGLWMTSRLNRD